MSEFTTNRAKEILLNIGKKLTKVQDIDKNDILEIIENEITGHKVFTSALSKMSQNELDKFREKLSIAIQSSTVKETSVWIEYTKKLYSNISQVEHKRMFGSILDTRLKVLDGLISLKKNFDKIFTSEIISVTNIKRTQLAVLGFIAQSIILSNWSEYMFTLLTSVLNGTENEIPKYRLMYLAKHVDQVIEFVNRLATLNKIDVLKDIEYVKSKGYDTPVFNDGTMTKSSSVLDSIMPGILAVATVVSGVVILYHLIKLIAETRAVMRHQSYLKKKEMKEWMESHVAKLKMDLQDMNPNDPQYQKLCKIIDLYDEKIKQYDEKINNYLNEE